MAVMGERQATIRVRIKSALSLGGGRDVFPGDECELPVEQARRLVLNTDAMVVPPTDAERDAWDREHGLIPQKEVGETK